MMQTVHRAWHWLPILVAVFLCETSGAKAAMPGTISYMGYVAYDSGAAFTGTVDIQVAFHTNPNSATLVQGVAWGPAEFEGVEVEQGYFSLALGGPEGPPLDVALFAAGPLWLAMWIDGVLMQPLQTVHAVPYAMTAGNASALGNLPPSAYATQAQLQALLDMLTQQQAAIEALQQEVTWTSACCDAVLPEGICLPVTPDDTPCNDGDPCTVSDACYGGQCIGKLAICDDGDPCTNDACVTGLGCTTTHNTAPCNDGNACTTADTCSAGTCLGTPLSCNDGKWCTTDACTNGSCSSTLQAGACLISGTCYANGASNPSNGCQGCDATTNPTGWSEVGACGTLSLGWSPSSIGFDVSNDGSLTAAGWSSSTQQVSATCYGSTGTVTGSAVLGSYAELGGSGRVYVARADVSKHSVVVVFPWPPGNNPTSLYAYFLNSSCNVIAGPTALPGTGQSLTGGSLEYFDVAMGDQGQSAIVYQAKPSGSTSYWPHLAQFNSSGGLIATNAYGVNLCNQSGNGIRVGMRETTGDVVVTCQGHSWVPVRAQRFSASGSAVDANMFVVPDSSSGSWYDSHITGMHDDGSFVVAWENYGNTRFDAAFFGPSANHLTTVTLGSASGNWFDGFRNQHARIQPLQSGGYLIPGPYQYTSFQWFGVYTKSGASLYSQPLTESVPLLRAAANDDLFALKNTSIYTNAPPYVY